MDLERQHTPNNKLFSVVCHCKEIPLPTPSCDLLDGRGSCEPVGCCCQLTLHYCCDTIVYTYNVAPCKIMTLWPRWQFPSKVRMLTAFAAGCELCHPCSLDPQGYPGVGVTSDATCCLHMDTSGEEENSGLQNVQV